ncbi:helix-turn-helix domain-containing protein, partial [Mesorhizobium sp. M0312]
SLRESLLRYAHAFLIQSSRTALVNGHSKIEERLARWLLMVQDRVEGDKIYLTHEFLATMLGARRPGVTTALQMLMPRSNAPLSRRLQQMRHALAVKSTGQSGSFVISTLL